MSRNLNIGVYVFILLIIFIISGYKDSEIKNSESIKLNIAVFKGEGAGDVSVTETLEALKIDKGIHGEEITASEIQDGKLSGFDALIIPGGSGSKQLLNLGESGQNIIRDFVIVQGKGIIGICAGAYMLSSTPDYPNLKLASSIHIDRAHYNRGRGLIEFELTEKGTAIFPELKGSRLFAQYYDGPILVKSDSIQGNFDELGKYVTDIHPDNFGPTGLTPGKSFLLNQKKGKGKVFLCAGHPESTPGMRWMVPRMARWVCGSNLVSYDKKWISPHKHDKEIIFDKALKKEEEQTFWLLFNENSQEQIKAMKILHSYRSRPAVRWNMGLLRSIHPETRMLAAKLLMETEYTAAIIDLEAAHKIEKDPEVKKVVQEAINFLRD
jgi:putative intracellular protease/amidase